MLQKVGNLFTGRDGSQGRLVIALSLVVGLFTGLAAFVLKFLVEEIEDLLTEGFDATQMNWLYLVYPAVGILLTSLFIRHVVRDDISHGVTKILYAISRKRARIRPHNRWSSVLASSITIGFGGSVGAEAPIVLTGSAIGSDLGKRFHLPPQTLMLLVGCGAAGAVAGIFKAPIAGLMFVIEVLMLDLTMRSLLPLLTTSITSVCVSYAFYGTAPLFDFSLNKAFTIDIIPGCILLGIACGLVSLYFTRGMNSLEQWFKHSVKNMWAKLLIGGVVLSVLIYIFPPLYGEGYDVIRQLINGDNLSALHNSPFEKYLIPTEFYAGLSSLNTQLLLLVYFIAIILLKIVASVATNGGGGVGGIFAPSLFMGAIVGFVTARIMNIAGLMVPETSFALVGMAGLMSGVMHAPLTGIFLIAELTGGYHLFMPLMIVSVISYLTIMLFEPHSLYAMRLAQKGELLTHNKDRNVLTLLKMDSVLETDFVTVFPEMTLGQLVQVISASKRNIFPVIDKDGHLRGILLLDEVRNIMFQPRLYKRFTVEQLMTSPPAVLRYDLPMEKVMETFEDTGAWNLPVVDEERRYLGFVSKSKIFNSYRHVLVHFSEE